MKVTPLDIRRKEFKRSMRGYADEEVDVFLDDVADEFERIFQENMELQDRIQRMEEQIESHAQLKGALEKTLVAAQLQADQMIGNARKEAELILKDAELKARHIVNDSYTETQRVQQSLIQLKHLEEDFRFKFRSLLEGHLKLLGDEPIAGSPSVGAPAAAARKPLPQPDAPAEAPAEEPVAKAVARPAEPEAEPVVATPAVGAPTATESPASEAQPARTQSDDTATEETDLAELLADDPSFESPADYAIDPDRPMEALPGDNAEPEDETRVLPRAAALASVEVAEAVEETGFVKEADRERADDTVESPTAESTPAPATQGFYFGKRIDDEDDGFFAQEAPAQDKSRDFEW